MKKLLLLSLLGGLTHAGYAQTAIKAGTVQLGGGINYVHNNESTKNNSGNSSYTSDYSSNQFTFNPYVGFFVADNLVVGLDLSYAASNQKVNASSYNSNADGSTITQLRVGPYVQYYHMLTDQFGLTGTVGAGYEHDSRPTTTSGNTVYLGQKNDGFYAGITPGVVFFPIPRFNIGASIGGLNYYRLSIKPDRVNSGYEDNASSFGANFGLSQLTFSGTYFFGR